MNSISSELAKQLKDAGFPYPDGYLYDDGVVKHPPTLEELIEACGDGFDYLRRYKDALDGHTIGWLAAAYGDDRILKGSTPDEAVILA
jgi:hypothetical protein